MRNIIVIVAALTSLLEQSSSSYNVTHTYTLGGEVTGIQGAHRTAIAETAGHGFATSGNDQAVVMFDLKTF